MISDGAGGHVPDHDMTVGVWHGYGYLSFTDAEHDYMVLDGDPRSPSYPKGVIFRVRRQMFG